MSRKNLVELTTASIVVRDETQIEANTATRVGTLFGDIVDWLGDRENVPQTLNDLNDVSTYGASSGNVLKFDGGKWIPGNEGSASVSITPLHGNEWTKIADYSINSVDGELWAPDGSQVSESMEQRTYFLNIEHDRVPTLPGIGDFYANENVFRKIEGGNTYTWTYTNENPGENEDTYQMWAWFVNNEPRQTYGPVRIYNSANKGSNGEDANEIEFIYRRSTTKQSQSDLQMWYGFLVNEKGDKVAGNAKTYREADAVPVDWTDTAQGIDETYKYEYRSYRVSDVDSDGKRIWGGTGFEYPVLISNWGEKGEDGDGVEYIFYASRTGNIDGGDINRPETWNENTPGKDGKNFQQNEFIADGSNWKDEPIDLKQSDLGPGAIEFVSIRKKIDDVWGSFCPAKFWTRYALDGVSSGYTVDFDNENMPVGTDNEGYVHDYHNSGYVHAYLNGQPLTYAETISGPNDFNYLIGSITRSDGGDTSTITAQPNGARVDVSISELSDFLSANAYIPITVTLPNGSIRNLECTLYGVPAGEPGTNIDLYYSTPLIRTDAIQSEDSIQPKFIQVGVKIGKGNNARVYLSDEHGYSTPGSAENLGYYFGYCFDYDNGNMISHFGNINLQNQSRHEALTIEMRRGDSFDTGQFVDSEDILYVRDGSNGASVSAVIPHYEARVDTSSTPIINENSPTSTVQTGWGPDKRFLYRRDLTIFTNGMSSWGDTYLCNVWNDGGSSGGGGNDGLMLVVEPPYAIFEEGYTREVDPNGNVTYVRGEVITSGWSATVQLFSGTTALDIDYYPKNAWDQIFLNCDGKITKTTDDANRPALKVEITKFSSISTITTGNVSFWVTLDNEPLVKVDIPVYVNRAGTRITEVWGDAETVISQKTTYSGASGNVLTIETIGKMVDDSTQWMKELWMSISGFSGTVIENYAQLLIDINQFNAMLSGYVYTISGDVTTLEERLAQIYMDIDGISGIVKDYKEVTVSGFTEIYYRMSLLEQSISGLSYTVKYYKELVDEINSQIANFTVNLYSISGIVSSHTETISGITDSIVQIIARLGEIDFSLSEYEYSLDQISIHIANINMTLNSIKASVREVSSTTNDLQSKYGELLITTSGISGHVQDLEGHISGDNLFPINGWVDDNDKYVIPVDGFHYYPKLTGSSITLKNLYLEGDTIYTVSHYDSPHIDFEITDASENAVSTITATTDAHDLYLGHARRIQTFKTNAAGYYKFVNPFGNRDGINTSWVRLSLYNPKLEKGDVATPFTYQIVQYDSLISQTSQSISLYVSSAETGLVSSLTKTGIDIELGKITLNADNTNINGNLNIYSADTGLVIYDPTNNLPVIVITGSDVNNTNSSAFNRSLSGYGEWHDEMYYTDRNHSPQIGRLYERTKVTLSTIEIYNSSTKNPQSINFGLSVLLKYINENLSAHTLKEWTFATTDLFEHYDSSRKVWTLTLPDNPSLRDYTPTETYDNCFFMVSITKRSYADSPFNDNDIIYYVLKDVTFYPSKCFRIGYNGVKFMVSDRKYLSISDSGITGIWCGADESATTIINEDNILLEHNEPSGKSSVCIGKVKYPQSIDPSQSFSAHGAFYSPRGTKYYGEMGSMARCVILSNKDFTTDDNYSLQPYYMANIDDGIISVCVDTGNTWVNIIFPDPADCPGKIYYLRERSTSVGRCVFCCVVNNGANNESESGDGKLLRNNDGSIFRYFSMRQANVILVSDGAYWIVHDTSDGAVTFSNVYYSWS